MKEAREKIIDAALELFSEKGFHATTTRKIAQKADVNEVTLFRHFKNKPALFREVLKQITILGFDSERVSGLEIDPEDAIRFVVEAVLETIEEHPRELRLLNLALLDDVDGFEEEFIVKNTTEAIRFISGAFKSLQEEGRILSKENPEILAELLLAQVSDIATQRVVRKKSSVKKYDRQVLADAIIRLFLS